MSIPKVLGSYGVSDNASVYVPGWVGNVAIDMLLDTGSAVTLIHKRLLDRVDKGKRMSEAKERVISANGQPLEILGTCQVRIRLGGINTYHNVLVANDITQDCLIGVDFLAKNNCLIDFEAGLVKAGNRDVSMGCRREEGVTCGKVRLVETVTVPGGHEMVMSANVGAVSDEVTGIIEPCPGFVSKHSILVARVVAKPKDNQVLVRLLNPSPEPIVLHRDTTLGTFTQCEVERSLKPNTKVCQVTSAGGTHKSSNSSKTKLTRLFNWEGTDITGPQKSRLNELLNEFEDVVSKGSADIGRTDRVRHRIPTGDASPVKQSPRRVPYHQKDEMDKNLKSMLDDGVVQPSSSPWASPVVLVKKKDGSTRFCVDYRRLNDVTRKDAYPLPRIDSTLDALGGAKYFSTIDLASGYWQVEVEPCDQEKTAFATPQGLFEFRVMPFGLTGAPSTFQRLMESVLAGLQWSTCLVYLDDIIIFSTTFEEHLERLREVFSRLRDAGLKVKPQKCQLFRKVVPFLGHVISKEGVATDPSKVDAVAKWPVPLTKTELRSFLGLASYYRRFIKNFAAVASPLHHALTVGNEKTFVWTTACDRAFSELKKCLVDAPVLSYPRSDEEFILDTDASDFGIGAVLSQIQDGEEKVIAYASRTLSKSERNYSVTKREMLALVFYSQHFRHYLYGRRFIARTDHDALRWLTNFKEPSGQVARWLEKLAEFDFKVQSRPGKRHGNADGLSRRPGQAAGVPEVSAVEIADTNSDGAWCPTWTAVELRSLQLADPAIRHVLSWRESRSDPPPKEELQGLSRTVHNLCSHWEVLEIRNGVLYRRYENEDGTTSEPLLVVPRCLVNDVLTSLHDSPTSGHLGITKTLAKVRERFYWPGQRQDVEEWLMKCEKCATGKGAKKGNRAPLVSCPPGYPMERIAIDILGPLPESSKGNKYIMVVGDYLSKWTESYAIPNQEARTVAQKLVDEFICRFGTPETIHTDQGRNFESSLFQEVCNLLGIKKTRTSAYHPEGDGMVERFNRTLEAMLSKYVTKHQRDWDVHLPRVMMAYRSSVQESTGFTPYHLMFGREIRLPADVMFGSTPDQPKDTHEYVKELRKNLEEAHELAREHLKTAQKRQKRYHDARGTGNGFGIGDRVWLFNSATKKGESRKLQSPWLGPFVILDKLSDVNYKIGAENGLGRKQIVHYNRLKFCKTQKIKNDLEQVHGQIDHADDEDDDSDKNSYVPDETDLMYAHDPPVFEYESPNPDRELPLIEEHQPPFQRQRREIRPPAWMDDFEVDIN